MVPNQKNTAIFYHWCCFSMFTSMFLTALQYMFWLHVIHNNNTNNSNNKHVWTWFSEMLKTAEHTECLTFSIFTARLWGLSTVYRWGNWHSQRASVRVGLARWNFILFLFWSRAGVMGASSRPKCMGSYSVYCYTHHTDPNRGLVDFRFRVAILPPFCLEGKQKKGLSSLRPSKSPRPSLLLNM